MNIEINEENIPDFSDEPKKLKVGLIENDDLYKEEVFRILNASPVVSDLTSWGSAEEYWRDKDKIPLDILLIDAGLPGINGVDLAGRLSMIKPDLSKIIITSMIRDELIMQAVKQGCAGYLLKAEIEDLENVISIVGRGGATISPSIAVRVLQSFQKPPESAAPGVSRLSPREFQILELLSSGNKPAQAAALLGLSLHTVRFHVKKIYKKLNINNQQEMMRIAHSMGIDPLNQSF